MGISGLLPALKSIQVQKHLSELSGQTVAVDAYVWLHKGVFTCATEMATGKPTSRYVHYAMERVRLLRHHKIEPYIVFDGGPLPAKMGTEIERKQKRDDNLARANELAEQGKHSQAREYYVKCVDVTPQMAFQFIKALKAESVSYVVAPYEADAQLAYLERVGIVDSILTEDSDLLVFGCRNVLYKLDTVAATVISISRDDFGTVTSSCAEPNSISLVGWSDTQFLHMAILSGCDYLASIPGIGLKTANALLRKWRTPEQVVRVVALEGKKSVPRNYMHKFKLAERCFRHQRVYDPLDGRLIHLAEADESEWDEESKAYIGRDIEPAIAKRIALGDVDPITLLPMQDINPGFTPHSRVLREVPVASKTPNKGKGKVTDKSPAKDGGILNFFGPNPKIPPRSKDPNAKPLKFKITAGKSSGKRTLADVMVQDMTAKKKKKQENTASLQSRFFGTPILSRAAKELKPIAGPSRLSPLALEDKENAEEGVEEEVDMDSLLAQGDLECEAMDLEEPVAEVEQEEGYISPSRSCSTDFDLSSPVRSGR
ncbi:PIN domain-like protein, partial [Mycena floridula]